MAQISTVGVGQDYTSLSAWVASPAYSTDWGVGNKATALIVGKVSGATTINTANTPNGVLIKENSIAYDGTNSATCDGLTSAGITLVIRDLGIEVSGIFIETTGSAIALYLGNFESVDANIHDLGVKTSLTNNDAHGIQTYNNGAFNGNIERVVVEGAGGFGVWLRNSCTGTLDHITVVDAAANGSAFRDGIVAGNADNIITNSLSLLAATASGSAEAFSGTFSASSGFNASSDTTAKGGSPQINRTTADLTNYAGSDFRTALASDLATSGSGGGFIGAFLEAGGGGITVTGTAIPTQTEADIVSGGKTIILTLNGDAFVASGATFDAERQGIIDGLNSAQTEATGWNNEVRDLEVVSSVVRDSDTQVTITLTASAAYDITAAETITATIPASALVTGTSPIIATPTFEVTAVGSLFQVAWARNSNYMIQ